MIGREGPGPERPGPDYPPEWDREPAEEDRCTCLPYPYGDGPEADCPVHGREVCATCGAPIAWQPGPPPGRPDLPGCWLGEDGAAGVRGSHGHRHAP